MSIAIDEFVDFIASGPSTAAVADWRASPEANRRVVALLDAERAGTLSDADRAELDRTLDLEHLARMVKARARVRLNARPA